jgi:hypothetical protein
MMLAGAMNEPLQGEGAGGMPGGLDILDLNAAAPVPVMIQGEAPGWLGAGVQPLHAGGVNDIDWDDDGGEQQAEEGEGEDELDEEDEEDISVCCQFCDETRRMVSDTFGLCTSRCLA